MFGFTNSPLNSYGRKNSSVAGIWERASFRPSMSVLGATRMGENDGNPSVRSAEALIMDRMRTHSMSFLRFELLTTRASNVAHGRETEAIAAAPHLGTTTRAACDRRSFGSFPCRTNVGSGAKSRRTRAFRRRVYQFSPAGAMNRRWLCFPRFTKIGPTSAAHLTAAGLSRLYATYRRRSPSGDLP